MVKYILFILFLISSSNLIAQVWNGDLTFSSQFDIDNFAFSSWTSVNGNLTIDDNLDFVHDINNLAGIAGLTSVSGNVIISHNNILTNLLYFNVTTVGGNVTISYNPALTTLSALTGLTVGNNLTISNNNALSNLTGLTNLSSFTGVLEISNNSSLNNINALSYLTSFNGDIAISSNPNLTNINGLSNITTFNGALSLAYCSFTNLNALANLTTIDGLSLQDNPSLANIDGLSNLTTINTGLTIWYNNSLNNLNGLSNLTTSVPFPLWIIGNNLLTDVSGLTGITSVTEIWIASNPLLTNLNGLNNLTTVEQNLDIQNNVSLQNIIGLNNLDSVGTDLTISNNTSLLNIDLTDLEYVGNDLSIINNDELTKFDGLSNLTTVGGNLSIQNNNLLSRYCGLYSLITNNGLVGDYNVLNNLVDPGQEDIIFGGFCSDTLVWYDNLMITSQTMVDSFSYNKIAGKLSVIETQSGNISNLGGLSELVSIRKELVILSNDSLINLTGLSNLVFIGSGLFVELNKNLASLNGLNNLIRIRDLLSIYGNDNLATLNGLNSLQSVGNIYINLNDALTNIDQLSNLNFLNGSSIYIANNFSLENINGLSNLTSDGQRLIEIGINSNSSLKNIGGLSSLCLVEDSLDISILENNSLMNISGLSNLSSVNYLRIEGNDTLQNIDGLHNLQSIKTDFIIANNDAITNLNALSNLFSVGQDLTVANNNSLYEFCGLFYLLFGNGLGGNFVCAGNAANPDISTITAGGPCPQNTFQLTVNVSNGWNMVSIPGLHPTDQNVSTWWQFRDPGANVFRYAGGYQSVTTAVPGTGYWMKHTGARTYNTGDEWPSDGIQIVAHDPLTGASGWNLFGGYELSVTAANVTTNPPGLQSGPIYKYAGGYSTATTLDPGYGYWIKLTGAGQIIIPETMAKSEPVEYFPENWGRIILTDATGRNYTLYGVKGEVDLSQYELPPAPPAGMFDIRYESGRIAENLNSSVKAIDMSGVTYPLTVRVEGMDIRLMDESGKMINTNLKSGENVVLENNTINKLMVSGELLPTVYSLEQNYPNPFNPSTVIEFSLPEDVANVKLSIYNALGEKVAELVNTSLTAGKYQYHWNARDVATGMYIYELRTEKFVSVKKMILIR